MTTATEQTGKQKFAPLPPGEYLARMNRYDVKPTKKGDTMISASFQIISGDFKDRLVFENYLINHSNPKAVVVGKGKLTKYLRAVGSKAEFADDPSVLERFIESPLVIEVGVEENAEYGDRNIVKKYKTR
jgi:hypothetical protein